MAFQHCITPKPNNGKPLNLNDMNKEEIRKTAWESVGDEKLFPNHSDKDIWNNGFDACYNILSTTSQTHKAMSAEEFLINQGYTKIVTYPNKEVVEITFRWETVIRLLNEYTSQFQPLPVGGKSVDNCFDEIGNKINTLQDVNLKNRLHAAKDLLKLHLQSSLPVQQPVSDGVEWISVEDRLPEIRKPVVIFTEYGRQATAYIINHSEPTYGWIDWMRPQHSYGSVTHWMPLPEPPKQ